MPEETYGHINSASCDGLTTTVTAARHFIGRHLHASMQAAQKQAGKLRFVIPDEESSTEHVVPRGRRKSLSKYAAENCWQKRQQKLKK